MPRDTNGNYLLPAGNPVQSGSLITSTWANTTMPDLGAEMSDSLSRSGKGAMSAEVKMADVGAIFNNEQTSGFRRQGPSDLRVAVSGTDILTITDTGLVVAGNLSGNVVATGSTVPRSLQDRFGQVFDIRDYGQVDTPANSTAAALAAIEAAKTAGGGAIYWSRGTLELLCDDSRFISHTNITYYPWNIGATKGRVVTSLLFDADNLFFFGDGDDCIVKLVGVSSNNYLNSICLWKECSNGGMYGLTFDGSRDTIGDATAGVVAIGKADYSTGTRKKKWFVRNCNLTQVGGSTVLAVDINDVTIQSNRADRAAIFADIEFSNGVKIDQNHTTRGQELCDLDKLVEDFTVTDNVSTESQANNDAIIELNGSKNGVVTGNVGVATGTVVTGVLINGKKTFGDQTLTDDQAQSVGILVANNTMKGSQRGFYIANALGSNPTRNYDAVDIEIVGNRAFDITKPDNLGIGFMIAGDGIICKNNIARDCDVGFQANLPRLTNFSFEGNKTYNSRYAGINFPGKHVDPLLLSIKNGIIKNNRAADSGSIGGATGEAQFGLDIVEMSEVLISNNIVTGVNTNIGTRLSATGTSHNNFIARENISEGKTHGFSIGANLLPNIIYEDNQGTLLNFDVVAKPPQLVVYRADAPFSAAHGNFRVGDIVRNSNPRSGSFEYWICIVAGTPGTFQGVNSIP